MQPESTWSGPVSAGQTRRLSAFAVGGRKSIGVLCKSSQDISCWIEHGRHTDTEGSLPWGSEAVAIDSTYNTVGGGQSIYFEVPGGSQQAQICLANAGGSDATVRVDVGVE